MKNTNPIIFTIIELIILGVFCYLLLQNYESKKETSYLETKIDTLNSELVNLKSAIKDSIYSKDVSYRIKELHQQISKVDDRNRDDFSKYQTLISEHLMWVGLIITLIVGLAGIVPPIFVSLNEKELKTTIENLNKKATRLEEEATGLKGEVEKIEETKKQIECTHKLIQVTQFKFDDKGRLGPDRLIIEYNDIINEHPEAAEAYCSRALEYIIKKDYRKAKVDCDKAIQINQDYALAYNRRGKTFIGLKDLKKAIVDLKEAIRLKPIYPPVNFHLGNIFSEYKETLNYNSALEYYNEAIKQDESFTLAYHKRGNVQRETENYTEALRDYKLALTIKPEFAIKEFYCDRAELYQILADKEQNIEKKNENQWLAEDNYDSYFNFDEYPKAYHQGNVYSEKSSPKMEEIEEYRKKALKCYNTAITIDTNLALTYYKRGNLYQDMGEYDKAIEDYNTAKRLNSEIRGIYLDRAKLYKILANKDDLKTQNKIEYKNLAIQDLNTSKTLNKKTLWCDLGNIYSKKNTPQDDDKALKCYRNAIVNDINIYFAYHNRGNFYREKGEYKAALRDYDEALLITQIFTDLDVYLDRAKLYDILAEKATTKDEKEEYIKLAKADRVAYEKSKNK